MNSEKGDVCVPLSHFAWGFLFFFFFPNGSSPSDYSMGFDTIWVVGQVALDCIRSTI